MKKRIKYFFMVFLLLVSITKVEALSLSKNDLTIEKGGSDRVELYANVDATVKRVDFTLVFTTYDIPAAFIVNGAYTDTNPDGITHSVILPEAQSGKILLGTVDINVKKEPTDTAGSVSIHTASAVTTSDERVYLDSQTINIKIGTPEPTTSPSATPSAPSESPKPSETPKPSEASASTSKTSAMLLDRIESKIVKITIKQANFNYNVRVSSDVEELDLKPIAKDKDTKIDITTQKIKELKDNKIIITAENGNLKETYTINVKIKGKNEVEIDKGEFVADKSYKSKWIIMSVILALSLAGSIIITKKK